MGTLTPSQLFRIGNALRNILVKTCPVDTGLLRSSIRVIESPKGLIIIMNEYGKYVEFGSNPYVIVPKSKKVLKFKSGGKDVFTKKVNHPGIRPTYFIRNAIKYNLPGIIKTELSK